MQTKLEAHESSGNKTEADQVKKEIKKEGKTESHSRRLAFAKLNKL